MSKPSTDLVVRSEKTPLQAVVSVICDTLCELPPADQVRAIEAVEITLGLKQPSRRSSIPESPAPLRRVEDIYQDQGYQEIPPPVEITMSGNIPIPGRRGEALVAITPPRNRWANRSRQVQPARNNTGYSVGGGVAAGTGQPAAYVYRIPR